MLYIRGLIKTTSTASFLILEGAAEAILRIINIRRIYIANFAIFKIATFWSYHLHSVSRNVAIFWLVVRMCDHRLQCMHACKACSMHEGRRYRYTFQRARVASSPEVPKVTWWTIATFLRLPFTLANFTWNLATFQKNRTPACDFSGDVSRVFMRCC